MSLLQIYVLCAFIYLVRSSKTFGSHDASLNGFEYEFIVSVTHWVVAI